MTIELAPGAENNAFATMLADLVRQNLESKPHKKKDFDALAGTVALIADDVLYFKVDDVTRANFEAEGMKPFRPYGQQRQTMQYYELPLRILEDTDALRRWVADAVDAARRAASQNMKRR